MSRFTNISAYFPAYSHGAAERCGGVGLLLTGFVVLATAAPIGASLEPPAPRAVTAQGGQVLDRALSGELGGSGLPSKLPIELRPEPGLAAGRAQPAASAAPMPPAARMAPVATPAVRAASTAPVPSLLAGHLAGASNEVAARPDAPKLARDWNGGGRSNGGGGAMVDGGSGGLSTEPGAGSPRTAAGAAPAFGPLRWLSQGLAFIRENRIGLLAGVGGLALLWMVQQARGRRRRA